LIENIGPARSLTVTFVVPVFAVIYRTLLLNEALSMWTVFCGAIIVCGTALSANLLKLPHQSSVPDTGHSRGRTHGNIVMGTCSN
jgi:drug/metabolite transporter (DMT)-like permease